MLFAVLVPPLHRNLSRFVPFSNGEQRLPKGVFLESPVARGIAGTAGTAGHENDGLRGTDPVRA